MFYGYFKNLDYSDPSVFLCCGEQTQPIFNECSQLNIGKLNCGKDLLKVVELIKNNTVAQICGGSNIKFKRTARQIWESGCYNGCADFTLMFEAICRALGVPTVHLQMADKKWIYSLSKGKSGNVICHHACECYIGGNWTYVDPIQEIVSENYDKNCFNIDDRYVIFSKSTDIFETGIRSLRENNIQMKKLFEGSNICNKIEISMKIKTAK